MYFPSYHVQNFFDYPDKVVKLAKTLNYNRNEGMWPGKRSENLADSKDPVVRGFFFDTCNRILKMIFCLTFTNETVHWEAEANFQLISAKDTITHKGWIHCDDPWIMVSIIYLNNFSAGTKIYRSINPHGQSFSTFQESEGRFEAYKSGKITENYESGLEKNNSNFEEIVSFSGSYNSMITFDGSIPHGADFSEMKNIDNDDERLTLVIMFNRILASSYPIPNLKRGTNEEI